MTFLDRRAFILYISVALALAFVDHRVRREKYREHVVTEYGPSVIAGTSGAPAKYRVLMPYALDYAAKRTGQDAYTLLLISEFVFILASLCMTHFYLRHWYDAGASLGGTLAVAALLPLTFTNSWTHPDTFPDLFLFTAGCYAVASRRDLVLATILLVGMFNRETIGFIALLWALHRRAEWRDRRTVGRAAILFGICAVVYVGLRWARGFEHYDMWMLGRNVEYMRLLPSGFDPYTRIAGFFWIVLLAAPGWLAWRGARRTGAPAFFAHALIVAAVFIVVAWFFAAIIETRVFVPVLPLLAPGAVRALAEERGGSRAVERGSGSDERR